jgi:phage host-nuclease inhibitor protein Gam
MKTTRIKSVPADITRANAESLVHEIADLTVQQRDIKNQIDAETLAIKDRFAGQIDSLAVAIRDKHQLVQTWANQNPDAFGKIKSIQFPAGKVGFRTGTPKLALLSRAWTWDKVLAAVERILPAFVRAKPEIDKEAILNQRDELAEFLPMAGIKVTQDESFFVEPDISALEARIKEAA